MNDEINKLARQIELLSQQAEQSANEIEKLKAEIALLKAAKPVSYNKTSLAKPTVPFVNFENFIGLRLIHFVGIIVLLIGLSIGVKYAIDANLISPLMRIILAYSAGLVLFILSLRLKDKLFLFSIILFSGAMASAYFTTYAAYEYYQLFPQIIAFILMLAITVCTVFSSLKYNKQEIAILGLAGAYAIPFFVSSEHGSIAVFFTYMLLINAGILIISFRKYWLPLTYISFSATWIIFIVSMLVRFNPATLWIFNVASFIFFLLFLVNCLAFKFLKKETITTSDTFILVADSIMLYIALNIIYHEKYNIATSNITLVFAVIYLAAALLAKKLQSTQVYLSNALFAMSFVAFSSFIALRFSGFTVTIIWVILAVAVFIAGMIFKIKTLRMGSICLFAITLIKMLVTDGERFSDIEKIISYIVTGVVLLAVSFLYQKFRQQIFSDDQVIDQGTGS